MRMRFFFGFLMIIILAAVLPSFAEELIYSEMNSYPVKNDPPRATWIEINPGNEPILIRRIRTYHYNNGHGAQPGKIIVMDGDQVADSWQAMGVTDGTPNIFWEAYVDFIMLPGHSYAFGDSDNDTASYNDESGGCGMFELYGIDPLPAGYDSSGLKTGGAASSSMPVGKTFTFGHYEQDNVLSNGKEPIEWQVLAVQDGRALVISKYALEGISWMDNSGLAGKDQESFSWWEWTQTNNITWETCLYRKWLNEDFYDLAFTQSEKEQIIPVRNETMDNPFFRTGGGNPTEDRIFLLSIDEAFRYFRTNEERQTTATEYAKSNGAMAFDDFGGATRWGLRSPGVSAGDNASVNIDGGVMLGFLNEPVDKVVLGMRPAFWMKTNTAP